MKQFVFNTAIVRGSTFSQGVRYSNFLCQSTTTAALVIGSATFAVQSGLTIPHLIRVRASVIAPPVDDPTQFVEGPEISYNSSLGMLDMTIDTIGGIAGATYSSWALSTAVDLTGTSFLASMRFSPASCAGKARTPQTLTINITGAPTLGIFTMYLTPTQTAALALGTYTYKVLFTPASSSDKFLVLSGTIEVIDV